MPSLFGADSDLPFGSKPVGQTGAWQLKGAVSDEFNAGEVDARKWNTAPPSWGPWSWDAKNAFQKDGKLVLQMTHEPHTRKNSPPLFYKSGILRSKMQRTYGYYEVRMKGCSLFPGACPAWHLPMNLTLSLGLRHPHIGWVGMDMKPQPNAATAEGFPTAMEVDYVRVWERK